LFEMRGVNFSVFFREMVDDRKSDEGETLVVPLAQIGVEMLTLAVEIETVGLEINEGKVEFFQMGKIIADLIGEKSGFAFTGDDDTANLIVFGKLGRFFEITPVDWLGLKTDFG